MNPLEILRKPEGSTDSSPVRRAAKTAGIEAYIRTPPAGSREEALEFLGRASVLVSLPQDSHTAIPSKIFEYMQFDAWLLALAEPGSATERVLRDSGADVVAPDDSKRIKGVLTSHYLEWKRKGRPRQPALDRGCSRRARADRLFKALERIVADEPQPPAESLEQPATADQGRS